MIPFGNHIVTLYHKDGSGYTRHILVNCSWRSSNERTLSGGATVITERTTCRIPPQYPCPVPGDMLVLGVVEDEADGEIALGRLLTSLRNQGYRAFRVQSCANNDTACPLPHFAATGA